MAFATIDSHRIRLFTEASRTLKARGTYGAIAGSHTLPLTSAGAQWLRAMTTGTVRKRAT